MATFHTLLFYGESRILIAREQRFFNAEFDVYEAADNKLLLIHFLMIEFQELRLVRLLIAGRLDHVLRFQAFVPSLRVLVHHEPYIFDGNTVYRFN